MVRLSKIVFGFETTAYPWKLEENLIFVLVSYLLYEVLITIYKILDEFLM